MNTEAAEPIEPETAPDVEAPAQEPGSEPARYEGPSSARLIATLGAVAMLSGVLIVFVYQATFERVAQNRAAALQAAIADVMPEGGANVASRATFAIRDGELVPVEGEDSPANPVYATYDADGTLVGVAIPAAAQGYQDTIRALFGYDPEAGELTGYKVLESKETPGLGDQIGKNPDFLAQIEGMPVAVADDGDGLAHAIETVKAGTKENPWEIDAIAGATISSEAVGVMLNEACQEVVPIIQRNLGRLAEAGVNNG